MGLLKRASSHRKQKDQQTTKSRGVNETMIAQRQNHFHVIEEAVNEHRKSLKERPSTSCGVEIRKHSSSRTRTAPREVKEQQPTCLEDLQKAGNVVEYKDGLDTFRFPTPSPRTPSMPRSATTATFQHSPSRLHSSSASPAIGIALGSPPHAPPTWGRSVTADKISTRMPQKLPSRRPPPPRTAERGFVDIDDLDIPRKKSGWKTFKDVFRRRPAVQAPQLAETSKPYSEVAPATERPITTLAPSEAPSLDLPRPDNNKQMHTRMHSGSSMGRHGPRSSSRLESHSPATRSSAMPTWKGKLRSLNTRGSTMPSPSPADERPSVDIFGSPSARHDSPMSQHGVQFMPSPTSRTPRLDLQFERPEFERYSVMFHQLLSNDSKPSLLERRQSKLPRRQSERPLDSIKIGDRLEALTQSPGTPKRALTSPHLTKRLSIRIDSASRRDVDSDAPSTAIRRPQLSQRAITLPVDGPSPTRANFPQSRKATLGSSPESPHSALFSENSLPTTPTTITTCTDTDSVRRLQQDHYHPEPAPTSEWSTTSSSTITIEKRPSLSGRTASEPYSRVKSPEDLERQLVRVSVARQVSVSRARNRVQRAVSNSNFKQPRKPQVVELQPGSTNRKSSAGILIMADEEEVSTRDRASAGPEVLSPRKIVVDSNGKRRMVRPPTLGPFPPDPLKLNPPTPRVGTFAEARR